jgi:predicted transcriptional regulator of viral defense system
MMRKRLLSPRQGFFVIVPLEYRLSGSPPPITFVDELMKFQGNVYYVGLLSAAALHGASHQAPVEFQVIVERQERAVQLERATMRFFVKKWIKETPTEQMKTASGLVPVSTPEATALDLVAYVDRAGHLDHVATVLSELHEKMTPKSLLAAVHRRGVELATVQRLGYLLDRVAPAFATDGLAKWQASQRPARARLRADRPARDAAVDERWQLLVNDVVEADET